MARESQTDDEPTRHADTLNYPIRQGDHIDKHLVAQTLGGLRTQTRPARPESDEPTPSTQAVALTQVSRYDDVMRALLYVPGSGQWLRASRHSGNSAWTQAEADWTVHEAGDTLVATGGTVERSPDDIDNEEQYVAGWLEVVAGDLSRDAEQGNTASLHDEFELVGRRTVRLQDPDGRKAFASFILGGTVDDRRTAMNLEASDE